MGDVLVRLGGPRKLRDERQGAQGEEHCQSEDWQSVTTKAHGITPDISARLRRSVWGTTHLGPTPDNARQNNAEYFGTLLRVLMDIGRCHVIVKVLKMT